MVNPTFTHEGKIIYPSQLRKVFLEPSDDDLYYYEDGELVLDLRDKPPAHEDPARAILSDFAESQIPIPTDFRRTRLASADQTAPEQDFLTSSEPDAATPSRLRRTFTKLGQSAMGLFRKPARPDTVPQQERLPALHTRRIRTLLGGAALCLVASAGLVSSVNEYSVSTAVTPNHIEIDHPPLASNTPTTLDLQTQTILLSPEFAAIVERPADFANMVQWNEENPGQDFKMALERWMAAS